MKIIIVLLVSIKIAYLFKLNPTYNNITGLIYNGTRYNPRRHPFIVTVKINESPGSTQHMICTGSLVKPLFVLTAAHCAYNKHASLVEVSMLDMFPM